MIEDVLKRYPDLTIGGLGNAPWDGSRWEDWLPALDAARKFIQEMPRRKTINRRGPSSYGLKHMMPAYCPNGVFIAALALEGVRFEREGGSPNVLMALGRRPVCPS